MSITIIPCNTPCCGTGCPECPGEFGTPTGIIIDFLESPTNGTCTECGQFAATGLGPFTLPRDTGDLCAFFLSFDDAGITCYDVTGVAGMYASIVDDGGTLIWDVDLLDGDASSIASWDFFGEDINLAATGCLDDWGETPFNLLTNESGICDWDRAGFPVSFTLTPLG